MCLALGGINFKKAVVVCTFALRTTACRVVLDDWNGFLVQFLASLDSSCFWFAVKNVTKYAYNLCHSYVIYAFKSVST